MEGEGGHSMACGRSVGKHVTLITTINATLITTITTAVVITAIIVPLLRYCYSTSITALLLL